MVIIGLIFKLHSVYNNIIYTFIITFIFEYLLYYARILFIITGYTVLSGKNNKLGENTHESKIHDSSCSHTEKISNDNNNNNNNSNNYLTENKSESYTSGNLFF